MTEEEIEALTRYYASRLPEALSRFEDFIKFERGTEIVEEKWNEVRRIYDKWREWKKKLEEK